LDNSETNENIIAIKMDAKKNDLIFLYNWYLFLSFERTNKTTNWIVIIVNIITVVSMTFFIMIYLF